MVSASAELCSAKLEARRWTEGASASCLTVFAGLLFIYFGMGVNL